MNGITKGLALCPEVPPVPLSAIRTEPPEAAPGKAVPWVPSGKQRRGREGAPGRNFSAIFERVMP